MKLDVHLSVTPNMQNPEKVPQCQTYKAQYSWSKYMLDFDKTPQDSEN